MSKVGCSTPGSGISGVQRSWLIDRRTQCLTLKQGTEQQFKVPGPSQSTSRLSTGIPLMARVLVSLACVNTIMQFGWIITNGVVTVPRAARNRDNSRRLESKKKKKILITLAPTFFLNDRHAAACHLVRKKRKKKKRKFISALLPFIPPAPRAGFKSKQVARIWLESVSVRSVMKFMALVMCSTSRDAPARRFASSPGIQNAEQPRAKLSLFSAGLSGGQGKFGPSVGLFLLTPTHFWAQPGFC